jgi:predicted membrane channel-forming protein YqfA (hemolysin III family)
MNLVSTSVFGGWCLIAGIGTLCGQFPRRYVTMDASEHWTWFLWFAGAITCMIVGMIWQFMHQKQRQHDADPADEITPELYV